MDNGVNFQRPKRKTQDVDFISIFTSTYFDMIARIEELEKSNKHLHDKVSLLQELLEDHMK